MLSFDNNKRKQSKFHHHRCSLLFVFYFLIRGHFIFIEFIEEKITVDGNQYVKKKTRKNRNGVCGGGGEENPWNWLQRATKQMTEIETEKYLQRDLSNSHAQIHKWKENRSAKMEYVHECEWLVTRSQVRKREMNLLCIFGSCKPSFLYVAFEHRESSKLHREMKAKNL